MKNFLTLLIISLILSSCNKSKPLTEFAKSLVETKIGDGNFYISLPKSYQLHKTKSVDFDVYDFNRQDTITKLDLYGGMYFGNHPSIFPLEDKSCKSEKIKSTVLNEEREWTVYSCSNLYSIQVIIDNKGDTGSMTKIHLFGRATNKDDLNKLLEIFGTFVKK